MGFKEDLAKAEKELNKKLTLVVKGGAISTFNSIIKQSPVKTGTFRGNWQATINTPATNTLDFGGKNTSYTDNPASKFVGYTLTDSLYLTNNLPYAEALETGHARQVPSGWVRTTVMTASDLITKKFTEILGS